MFAKLYGTDADQVLVMLDTNEKAEPCIKFSCEPRGAGVCTFAISYADTDHGWDAAERRFAEVDEAMARKAVEENILSLLAPCKES